MDHDELKRRRSLAKEMDIGLVAYAVEPYAVSVWSVARSASLAFARLGRLLSLNASALDAFSTFHECINHSGNVSKFFFPPQKRNYFAKNRAKEMRAYFDVDANSPLHDRKLRDTLEHFDEKLDDFFLMFDGGIILPNPIFGDVDISDDPNGTAFKFLDVHTEAAIILGEVFMYGPLRNEVSRIARKFAFH